MSDPLHTSVAVDGLYSLLEPIPSSNENEQAELEAFRDDWLEDLLADAPSAEVVNHRFMEKLLRDLFDSDGETCELFVADESSESNLGAVCYLAAEPGEGVPGNTWYLVHSRLDKFQHAGSSLIDSGRQAIEALLSRDRIVDGFTNELSHRLHGFLQNHGPQDRLVFLLCTGDDLQHNEKQELEDLKAIGTARLGGYFDVQNVSIETIHHRMQSQGANRRNLQIQLNTTIASQDQNLMVGSTRLMDIYRFMLEYKYHTGDLDLLYEKNVRTYLGNRHRVNKAIEKTLEETPERFGLYNNGITLVAERCQRRCDGTYALTNPYVVNGCQTTRSIWSVLHRKVTSANTLPTKETCEWEKKLSQSVVVTKIVVTGKNGDDLLTETTRYTNFQNAVRAKDFLSLERDFRIWSSVFAERYGVFLEIQRGAWDAQRAMQCENPQGVKHYDKCANAFGLLKTYAAGWLDQPGVAFGKNSPFAPGGTLFHSIKTEEGFGVESLYAAHLIASLASDYGFGTGASKPKRGPTKFLFIYLAVSLIRKLLVNYGSESTNSALAKAVIAFQRANLLQDVGRIAIEVVDAYMTQGNEDCLYLEPGFLQLKDRNAFMKAERFCNDDSFSPRIREHVILASKQLRGEISQEQLHQILSMEC